MDTTLIMIAHQQVVVEEVAWMDWTVEVGVQQDRGVLPLLLVLMALTLMMMSEDMEGMSTSMDQEAGEDTSEVELGPTISLSVLVVEVINASAVSIRKHYYRSNEYDLPHRRIKLRRRLFSI
jgi:hypothetical protein